MFEKDGWIEPTGVIGRVLYYFGYTKITQYPPSLIEDHREASELCRTANERIAELEGKLDGKQIAIDAFDKILDSVVNKRDALQARIDAQDSELADYVQTVQRLNKRIGELEEAAIPPDVIYCVHCDQEFDAHSLSLQDRRDMMAGHFKICERHPTRILQARIDAAVEQVRKDLEVSEWNEYTHVILKEILKILTNDEPPSGIKTLQERARIAMTAHEYEESLPQDRKRGGDWLAGYMYGILRGFDAPQGKGGG